MAHGENVIRLTLIDQYLKQQREPTAVERFAQKHAKTPSGGGYYRELIPLTQPAPGEQYAFQVDLDRCTSCKACVTACHSMNGLDEDETWRFVGHLHGGTPSEPLQQSVTTACHHCVDPACLSGCPVQAYEKHPVTGIVKHLDDQCIGCQYCTLTCPYDVPQYSARKGIVRKCDMCSDRLAAGEPPACVQACPNEAISIRIVSQAEARQNAAGEPFLPGAPSPKITAPTTTFQSQRAFPRNTLPVDHHAVQPAHRHMPLVVMLVLIQLATGMFALDLGLRPFLPEAFASSFRPLHAAVALAFALLALAASTFHLGRPLYAFRAVLGLRTSWMSREVVVLGGLAACAVAYTAFVWRGPLLAFAGLPPLPAATVQWLEPVLGGVVVGVGLLGTLCSVMIYAVTRRRFWNVRDTALKFFGSALVLGSAATTWACAATSLRLGEPPAGRAPLFLGLAALTAAAVLAKLASELRILRQLRAATHEDLARTARLLVTDLRRVLRARLALGLLGGVVLPALVALAAHSSSAGGALTLMAAASASVLVIGELLERILFFAAVSAPRMPGRLR